MFKLSYKKFKKNANEHVNYFETTSDSNNDIEETTIHIPLSMLHP